MISSLWIIYKKAGKPGWGSLIPIYNFYLLCDIVYHKGWLMILLFVPIVGEIFMLILIFRLAKSFGKGVGFGLGLLFFPILFFPLLAFGNAQYRFLINQSPVVNQTVSQENTISNPDVKEKEEMVENPSDSKLNILLGPAHSPSSDSLVESTVSPTSPVNGVGGTGEEFVNAINSVGFISNNDQGNPSSGSDPSTLSLSNNPNQAVEGEVKSSNDPSLNELNPNPIQSTPSSQPNSNLTPMEDSSNRPFDFVAPVESAPSFASQIPEVVPITPIVDPIPSVIVQSNADSVAPVDGTSSNSMSPSQTNTNLLYKESESGKTNPGSYPSGGNRDVSLDFVAPILPIEQTPSLPPKVEENGVSNPVSSDLNPFPKQEVTTGNSFMVNPVGTPQSQSTNLLENPSPVPSIDGAIPLTTPVVENSTFSSTMPSQPVEQIHSVSPVDYSQVSNSNDGSNPMS